jgi:hypothetical protein
MVLRELVAKFGMQLDGRGFQQADRAVTGLSGRLVKLKALFTGFQGLQGLLIGGSIAYTFKRLVEMGSDANETLNVLNEVFKHNSQAVQDWAAAYGREVGRSQYELRELAGTLGATLGPMLNNNADAAAEMSKKLAQLATDLGSFYNAADQDVLVALRAGMVGEAEPMRRFGVVMLESTLQAYALSQGIRKNIKEMTIAERTQLRYAFIMDQTKTAQGDALRTANGYANAIKGVTGAFKDFAIKLMLTTMPAIAGFTAKVREWMRALDDATMSSANIQAALLTLGAVAATVAVKMLLPWLPWIALFGALWIAIDDVLTTLDGGDSVIKRFVDGLAGVGATQEYLDNYKAGLVVLRDHMEAANKAMQAFGADINRSWEAMGQAFDLFAADLASLPDKLSGMVGALGAIWDQAKEDVYRFYAEVRAKLDDLIPESLRGIWNVVSRAAESVGVSAASVMEKGAEQRKLAAKTAEKSAAVMAAYNAQEAAAVAARAPGKGRPVINDLRTRMYATGRGLAAPAGYSVRQENKINIQVDARGAKDPERVGREVERGAKRALENTPKNVMAALKTGV